jgi:hypothetical protein
VRVEIVGNCGGEGGLHGLARAIGGDWSEPGILRDLQEVVASRAAKLLGVRFEGLRTGMPRVCHCEHAREAPTRQSSEGTSTHDITDVGDLACA